MIIEKEMGITRAVSRHDSLYTSDVSLRSG